MTSKRFVESVVQPVVQPQTCQVSRISHETHTFSMSLTLSLGTVEISRIFLLNEKQYF